MNNYDHPTETAQWCEYDNSYLSGYSSGTYSYDTLASAKAACLERDDCGGVTQEPHNNNRYTLRVRPELLDSTSSEVTWMICGTG